ncbi:S-adenosyl-L-methionine-dependent methyltransferase [Sporormia fimetaria CBS 119925]|uniref:S-adenosyl-L-methionine-dependent methyltransferase n=1 Tax=Sporormia fimetaria CBS 119925 TaxID=1340428 RepID=A0A6A6VAR8_9PLEO|nr:S-adenosyl-L-methionine-dependent methyltransferase [Sporormia fimetaria CBS 119925]
MSTVSTVLDELYHGHRAVQSYKDVETVTGLFSDLLVHEMNIPEYADDEDLSVLDIACGTGAATASLYAALPRQKWDTTKVLATDISQPFLEFIKERGAREGWKAMETKSAEGANVDAPAASFSHILLNFGIMFMGPSLLPTCLSLLRPGGAIGITTWHVLPWHDQVSRAASLLSPSPKVLTQQELLKTYHFKEGQFEDPAYMKRILEEAGFVDVRSEVRECTTVTTNEVVARTLGIPLKLIGNEWEEDTRQQVRELVLQGLAEKFGEEGPAKLKWVGVVTVGRKAG